MALNGLLTWDTSVPALTRQKQGQRVRKMIAFIAFYLIFLYLCVSYTLMDSATLIGQMEKAGWVLRSVKGSHHVYTHPDRPGHITVPHPKKDLGTGLVHKLLKQAGLK